MSLSIPTWVLVSTLLYLSHKISTLPAPQRTLKTFTLEEVAPLNPDFYPERFTVEWFSDTEYIYRDVGAGIKKHDIGSDTYTTLISEENLLNLSSHSISSFSKDGKYLLVASNRKKMYRYSSYADYSVYDLENKNVRNLSEGPLQVVSWSPAGPALAFVQNNNVYYVKDVDIPDIHQLTIVGEPGQVYCGVADWIYEEEVFNTPEAFWFSADGKYLAVAIFNDTDVETASYPYYGDPLNLTNQYPQIISFKYPKAGRENPKATLQVFDLSEPEIKSFGIPAPSNVGSDHILGRVNWISDKDLLILWLNRRQNVSVLVKCDMSLHGCHSVKQRKEPNGWIDINQPLYDSDGTRMVDIEPMREGQKRYMHATLFDLHKQSTTDLSPGNCTVTSVVGWNEESDTVYFIVAPESIPSQRQLWAYSNGSTTCVSCNTSGCHSVSASFSPKSTYAVVTCSASLAPPKSYMYFTKNDTFKLVVDNKDLSDRLNRYKKPFLSFNKLNLGEGIKANIKLLLPPDMSPDQKYPLIVRVYAGPGTSRVKDAFDLDFYDQYLSINRSFVVASIDVRGSGVMGVEAMHSINNALGTYEVTDTLTAISALLETTPVIEPSRVGVWGWSYGGFTASMMLARDEQRLLRCAAAVAPVTSWRYYDSIYTERYMDTPAANPSGYIRAEVGAAAAAAASRLRTRRLLLVHGTGDDNVHYQNTMMLAKQLQRLDIPYEQMSYPDESHSLLGVSRHFTHTLDTFWTKCFNL